MDIPELNGEHSGRHRIRLPQEIDVAVTPRVLKLIDSAPFQRLREISQLGLVQLVYPGANHSRFEHSLGVYRNCVDVLKRLLRNDAFAEIVDERGVRSLLAAALLHDVGHWPFCHAIEDMQLSAVPPHESLASKSIRGSEIADILSHDWQIELEDVIQLLVPVDKKTIAPGQKLLRSILSGPIDVDKLDYLYRDSLHAGVPYGMNFDRQRLIESLCFNQSGDGLAIDAKGKTAAEMLVFARYVMFSEVYWHHAVRAATSMLQRLVYQWSCEGSLESIFQLNDSDWRAFFNQASTGKPWRNLYQGLFSQHRRIYKRLAQFDALDSAELHQKLARKDYRWLIDCSGRLAAEIQRQTGKLVQPHQVLIDAPPVGLEVQFRVEVHDAKRNQYRPLGDVSPVTKVLATHQFDDMVKRVRVFVDPQLQLEDKIDINSMMYKIVD